MAQEALEDMLGQDMPGGNDEGHKKAKQGPRKRVSQACDKCRSRKDKCDGKKPACSTCITNGRTCSYDANVKKRGLPEGYVRGLEKLWGLAIRDVEEVEDGVLSALAGDEDSIGTPLDVWNDETNSENLVELWRKSQISRELERLLSSQDLSGDMKKRRVESDASVQMKMQPASQPSFHQLNARNAQGQPPPQRTEWGDKRFDRRSTNDFLDSPKPNPFQDNSVFAGEGLESILTPSTPCAAHTPGVVHNDMPELPSETWHLIDVYFSYTHSWLPIIEKHDLMRTSYQYSQNRHLYSSGASGEFAALWAVLAYAKFQHRAINNIPHALGPVSEMVWTAERMYSQARSLIPNEEGSLDIGHVQALLILSLANMGMSYFGRAWSLIGQAVRIAVELELDQSSDIVSSSKSKSRSKHVFLGCFAIDTLISARMNRRPHLRSNDLDNIGLVNQDGLEEWDPWTDCLTVRRSTAGSSRVPASILSTFNQLIQVLKILNEAACLPGELNQLQASTVILEKLHVWSQAQKPPLYYDSTASGSEQALSLLPHQYHLHNVYLMTLAKAQLLSFSNGREASNLEPCTRSARHIAHLFDQHSITFGVLIIPPTYEYYVRTAYEVVHAVQSSIESTHIVLDDWKRRLDHCLDAMEPAWPVFESFKASVTYQVVSRPRRQSQIAFDLISGLGQDNDTSMSGKTPHSLSNYDAMNAYSPQTLMPNTSGSSQHSRDYVQPDLTPKHLNRSASFGQNPNNSGLPTNPMSIYQNAHVQWGNAQPKLLANKTPLETVLETSAGQRASFEIAHPDQPRVHRSLTTSSADIEFDPMFNELMRLDATEWSGNWDQSLVNLGFTENDNMNQDFYAFCQEPDPLHQNNVFQQLVANSNAEATDFFENSAFGGMVFGGLGGIGEENEGIEAGQILQALSAAEDHRSGR